MTLKKARLRRRHNRETADYPHSVMAVRRVNPNVAIVIVYVDSTMARNVAGFPQWIMDSAAVNKMVGLKARLHRDRHAIARGRMTRRDLMIKAERCVHRCRVHP